MSATHRIFGLMMGGVVTDNNFSKTNIDTKKMLVDVM
jgi:di/tricarboxylate transporter